MKKIFFIAFVGLLFSCEKEKIEPNTTFSNGCFIQDEKSLTPVNVTGGQETEGESTGTITDPNSDRDENARRRN
jgi:hypothetical protein